MNNSSSIQWKVHVNMQNDNKTKAMILYIIQTKNFDATFVLK